MSDHPHRRGTIRREPRLRPGMEAPVSGRTARAARRATGSGRDARAAAARASQPAPAWGRDDLTCPITVRDRNRLLDHAHAHPWPGDTPLDCPLHRLETTSINEPGRPVRLLISVDVNYHGSGWFANSDWEKCLHISISHPRTDRPRLYLPGPETVHTVPILGHDVEAPEGIEIRNWGRVFFRGHAPKSWLEPAVGPLDPHRAPGVAHLRLYLDQDDRPMMPRGEPYHLRPFADGSSPAKITEGRLGADVR